MNSGIKNGSLFSDAPAERRPERIFSLVSADRRQAGAPALEEAGEELFTFTAFPSLQCVADHQRAGTNHRGVSPADQTQASLPSEEAVLFLLFGLLRSGQVRLRRLVGWQDLASSQMEAA
jgi:hypothetical protein